MLQQSIQKELSDKAVAAAAEENRQLREQLAAMQSVYTETEKHIELEETVEDDHPSSELPTLNDLILDWSDKWEIGHIPLTELQTIIRTYA